MWFAWVKQLFHCILHILRHILEPSVVSPVLRSIFSESVVFQTVIGDDILVQVQQNAQAGSCREGMSRRHRDIITAVNVVFFCKTGGRQEFSHREVREMYHGGTFDLDGSKGTGTSRQKRIYWSFKGPFLMEFRSLALLDIGFQQAC